MQKIIPFLWFNKAAEDAARLYTSVIPNSSIQGISRYGNEGFDIHHMPQGTAMSVNFTLHGIFFTALNGGPEFSPNPSISFHVKCKTIDEVDEIWQKLSPGGKMLMELGEYPFSKRYGWLEDRYGFSWQIIYSDAQFTQAITPALMYTGVNAGHAEEAMDRYVKTFNQNPKKSVKSAITTISRYGKGMEPDTEDSVSYGSFTLEGMEFVVMDSAHEHKFFFNEAVSLAISCNDQKEVDHFWTSLIADGGRESQCGWLTDKFGVSWQVIPDRLGELLSDSDKTKAGRVMNAMLQMRKIDISKLESAANA